MDIFFQECPEKPKDWPVGPNLPQWPNGGLLFVKGSFLSAMRSERFAICTTFSFHYQVFTGCFTFLRNPRNRHDVCLAFAREPNRVCFDQQCMEIYILKWNFFSFSAWKLMAHYLLFFHGNAVQRRGSKVIFMTGNNSFHSTITCSFFHLLGLFFFPDVCDRRGLLCLLVWGCKAEHLSWLRIFC